jgi:hypothetical protein
VQNLEQPIIYRDKSHDTPKDAQAQLRPGKQKHGEIAKPYSHGSINESVDPTTTRKERENPKTVQCVELPSPLDPRTEARSSSTRARGRISLSHERTAGGTAKPSRVRQCHHGSQPRLLRRAAGLPPTATRSAGKGRSLTSILAPRHGRRQTHMWRRGGGDGGAVGGVRKRGKGVQRHHHHRQ